MNTHYHIITPLSASAVTVYETRHLGGNKVGASGALNGYPRNTC